MRVTEAAAIAAGRHMGRGDKERVDQAAVDAMRPVLQSVQMDGIVVIGEGEKDEAPMLYNGERVGSGVPPEVDLAVDPVDGTTLTAKSLPDAIAVIAVAERGTMFDPGPCVYMEKLAVAGDVADVVDLDAPIAENLRRIAQRRGKRADDITVAILERPRHAELVARSWPRARVKYLLDGDVAGAILAADETSTIDACVGIGGTPEGVIAACALRCLDGQILGRLYPRDDAERAAALERATTSIACCAPRIWSPGQDIFFAATGVTEGELLGAVGTPAADPDPVARCDRSPERFGSSRAATTRSARTSSGPGRRRSAAPAVPAGSPSSSSRSPRLRRRRGERGCATRQAESAGGGHAQPLRAHLPRHRHPVEQLDEPAAGDRPSSTRWPTRRPCAGASAR